MNTATIRLLSWPGGFALVRHTERTYDLALRLVRLKQARRFNGKLCGYRLEFWEVEPPASETGERRLIRLRKCQWLPVKTYPEAKAEFDRQAAIVKAEERSAKTSPPDKFAQSAIEAQRRVLRKPYPVTSRILNRIAALIHTAKKIGSNPNNEQLQKLNTQAVESWKVETLKLIGKPVDDDSLRCSADVFGNQELAGIVADALSRAGTKVDRIDYELAHGWMVKGYVDMTVAEYAAAVAAVVGGKPSPSLILKRRQRLGLDTRRDRPGPRERYAGE